MAHAAPRTLWKGAISLGLVHIPVALHSATVDTRPKMRMIDQATGAAVGYQKVDKSTGKALESADVVKGMEVDPGRFVTLTREEIREALPRTTQTLEIEAFVKLAEVPAAFYNKPYFTSPGHGANKVYALLRDVLRSTGRAGVGRIVVSSRQHLALVAPCGNGLVINLLRWADEVRDMADLPLPGSAEDEGLSERELKMGEQLVLDLSDDWHPERFRDEFKDKLEALVEAKRKAGDIHDAPELLEAEVPAQTADVIDLTELLRKSLKRVAPAAEAPRRKSTSAQGSSAHKAANDEAARERAAAAAKPAAKARASARLPRRKAPP